MAPEPKDHAMEARLTAVEGFVAETAKWRQRTETWQERIESEQLRRHRENEDRLGRIEGFVQETKEHLNRQDRLAEKSDVKMERALDILSGISMKLAGQDGQMRLLKWLAGVIFGGGFVTAVIEWFGHK